MIRPLTGAVLAVAFAHILRGRGGDAISYAAGSGVLGEGRLTEKQKLSQEIDQGEVSPPGIGDAPEEKPAKKSKKKKKTAKK